MTISAVTLYHPQSHNLLNKSVFDSDVVKQIKIACGTTKVDGVDFYESNDFFPTYASWNSALFETSVILTVWEHLDELVGDNDVAILHSDVTMHYDCNTTWSTINSLLADNTNKAIGLTVNSNLSSLWKDVLIPDTSMYIPRNDPMNLHDFDCNISVWKYLKEYDSDIYEWAMDTQPRLVYSHQFCCSKDTFNKFGYMLYKTASNFRLGDVGLWTPHVFERLVALYLARIGGDPILTTCFWHHSSSSSVGSGDLSLYGSRPRKYYKTVPKILKTREHH